MNQMRKTILRTMILSALFLMMSIPCFTIHVSAATDNNDKDLRQVSCTAKTVTVKWKSQQGIDKEDPTIKREMKKYTLRIIAMIVDDGLKEYNGTPSQTFQENGSKEYTATLKLPANFWGKGIVYLTYDLYKKNTETGKYEFEQEVKDSIELFCNVFTKPPRPSKNEFGITDDVRGNSLLIKSWVNVEPPKWFYESDIELYKGNKKLKTADLSYWGDEIKLKRGSAYQYRIRYRIRTSDKTALYSAWGPWKGFVVPKDISVGSKPNKKGFTITLGKIAGVSKYTVYTSLKKKAGYKKAKTFKVKNKKKFTVKITKKYKKGKKNYIKLVPYINLKHYKGPSEFQIVTPRALKIYK